jgi:hypothetical protein
MAEALPDYLSKRALAGVLLLLMFGFFESDITRTFAERREKLEDLCRKITYNLLTHS